MKCPVCDVELLMTERERIEIDYCPKCRGIWLDRGELDKIIERSTMGASQAYVPETEGRYDRVAPPVHDEERKHHGRKKHKRKSFLQELFEFD